MSAAVTPTRTCEGCGETLYELLDGTDACRRCGLRPNTGRVLREILVDVEAFIRRFIAFRDDHQAAAVTLWVPHVYAIDAAPAAAYLRIISATEEAGKTTLLEVLEALLGDRALNAVSASPAWVFRAREKRGPVALLLDEIDQTLRGRKDDGARDLLAIVNAGYRRSAKVGRTVGRDHEPREFKAFGPCAIAGLGRLHPTTESRCVPIVLERKPRRAGERWMPHLVEDEARVLRERLAAWATVAVGELAEARPDIPEGLRDRHAEVWWNLFAIADMADGEWPSRARSAALALHNGQDFTETASLGVLLLAHVREAFEEAGADRLPTAELLRHLVANEEGPWGRFRGGRAEPRGTPARRGHRPGAPPPPVRDQAEGDPDAGWLHPSRVRPPRLRESVGPVPSPGGGCNTRNRRNAPGQGCCIFCIRCIRSPGRSRARRRRARLLPGRRGGPGGGGLRGPRAPAARRG